MTEKENLKEEVRTMRKSILVALVMAVVFAWAMAASAFQLEFHGEYGTKIQTTNTLGMVGKEGDVDWNEFAPVDEIGKQDLDDTWAELQFRLWTVASSDDGNVKGVWSMEYGTKRFGEDTSGAGDGMAFANDEDDIEVRLMYLDFQLPYFCSENRLTVGLQQIDINEWLWHETAAGIKNYGSFTVGETKVDYQIGWARDADSIDRNDTNDNDYWFAKVDFELKELLKVDTFDVGAFFVYANEAQNHIQPWWVGAEVNFAGYKGILFDLDLIYMGGDSDLPGQDDLDAWFFHGTAGYQWTDQLKTSFTFWYASGDDDNDGDIEYYNTIVTHTYGSIILFEDATFDDGWYASGNPYLDPQYGFFMYRFRVDYQATPKLNVAAAVNYMQLDEDVEYGGDSDDSIGWEVDVYADYELYKNFKVNFAAGYLFTDDAMDVFAARATDGRENDADDMYRVTVGVSYSF